MEHSNPTSASRDVPAYGSHASASASPMPAPRARAAMHPVADTPVSRAGMQKSQMGSYPNTQARARAYDDSGTTALRLHWHLLLWREAERAVW